MDLMGMILELYIEVIEFIGLFLWLLNEVVKLMEVMEIVSVSFKLLN